MHSWPHFLVPQCKQVPQKVILEALDNKYLAMLEDKTMGFATIMLQAMLRHLIS